MIYVENHPLDDWMTQKKRDIVLKNRPLDHWMTQKKTGHSFEKQTIGWLDGWMLNWS